MRFIGRMLLWIVLIVVVAAGLLYWNRANMVAQAMEEQLQTGVTIENIEIGSKVVVVHGLVIQNIDGSQIEPALKVESVSVEVDFWEMWKGKETTIKRLEIDRPIIAVELYDKKGEDNNWTRMLAHLKEDQATIDAGEKEFLIEHLLVKKIRVRAVGGPIGEEVVEADVDQIEKRNVRSAADVPLEAIIQAITREVVNRAIRKAVQEPVEFGKKLIDKKGKELLDQPKKLLDKGFKGIFGK